MVLIITWPNQALERTGLSIWAWPWIFWFAHVSSPVAQLGRWAKSHLMKRRSIYGFQSRRAGFVQVEPLLAIVMLVVMLCLAIPTMQRRGVPWLPGLGIVFAVWICSIMILGLWRPSFWWKRRSAPPTPMPAENSKNDKPVAQQDAGPNDEERG